MFDGEGSLHILAVNSKEEQLCELLWLAHSEMSPKEFEMLLLQTCTGLFFKFETPINHFGATPLAYAASFGLRAIFDLLFVNEAEGRPGLLSPAQKRLVINGERPQAGGRTPALKHGYCIVSLSLTRDPQPCTIIRSVFV